MIMKKEFEAKNDCEVLAWASSLHSQRWMLCQVLANTVGLLVKEKAKAQEGEKRAVKKKKKMINSKTAFLKNISTTKHFIGFHQNQFIFSSLSCW